MKREASEMEKVRKTGKDLSFCVLTFAVVVVFSLNAIALGADNGRVSLFSMETAEEVAKFDNDNTGAKLALTHEVASDGKGALAITPSGSAPETKIGVELSGKDLVDWNKHDVVSVQVYIPATMKVVPNSFFLGMADLSKGWEWVDGVFAEADVSPGWNEIIYVLSDGMKNVKENGKYKLYFSFFRTDMDKQKVPLAETFYVDAVGLGTFESLSLPPVAVDGEFAAAWTVEYERELVGYENDGTGAVFELAPDVTLDGKCAVAIIPNGSAPETKLALGLAGDALAEWIGKEKLAIDLYMPEGNELVPNGFFLGMADVTDGWEWVDGTFTAAEVVPGWNRISYVLSEQMSKLDPDGEYILYFSWFHENESHVKIPLKEKFYIIPPFESRPAQENYARLTLNVTFNQGSSTVAYLPLIITMNENSPKVGIGNWYFAYPASPFAFWVSNNDRNNVKRFASLGDPLGIAESLGSGIVLNARGEVAGAKANLYAAGLSGGNAFLGRVTYGLPQNFEFGIVGAYTDGRGEEVPADLTFGVDLAGKVPGLGADLTLAGAGYWEKDGAKWFEGEENNWAYLVELGNMKAGPASFSAKYTEVGEGFKSAYASSNDTALLNAYKDSAAAEVRAEIELPAVVQTDLVMGNTLWMNQADHDPVWNETTAKVIVDPIEDLKLTVSGAYRSDLCDGDVDYTGYNAHADVVYGNFGVDFKPFVDYKTGYYADNAVHEGKRVDTIVGLNVKGTPVDGLFLETEAKFTVEEPKTELLGYGLYCTEIAPAFVNSARSELAGVSSYAKESDGDPSSEMYGFAGSMIDITDAVYAKFGLLTRDEKGGLALGLDLNWKVSEKIRTSLAYTFRDKGLMPPADPNMWRPFDDEGKNWFKASVSGTLGQSTVTFSYGMDGRREADTTGFHAGKPWAYLRNYPANYMDWQLITMNVRVPF